MVYIHHNRVCHAALRVPDIISDAEDIWGTSVEPSYHPGNVVAKGL